MIVYGIRNNTEIGEELFKGDMSECKTFCKALIPSDFYSLNICEDNGIIAKRLFAHGARAKDFSELLK